MRLHTRQIQSIVIEEAAEWFVRNRDGRLSADERVAFINWLKLSPLNVEEYLKAAAMSNSLHGALEGDATDIDMLLAQGEADTRDGITPIWSGAAPTENRQRWVWPRLALAGAATLLLVLAGTAWFERDGERFGLPKSYETARSEQRTWQLPDGTHLHLNTDSAVTVRFNGKERLVEVDRGQALFQVAHNNSRRFRVYAGNTSVIAVGTEFDVMRTTDVTRVTVVEGKVAVFAGQPPEATAEALLPSQGLALNAGQQVQLNDHARVIKPTPVNAQHAVAWMQRQIAFDQQPLGDIAEEFNRYNVTPIVVQSDRLRVLPISGVFNAYDTDSFVEFVSRLDGVKIERSSERILIRIKEQ